MPYLERGSELKRRRMFPECLDDESVRATHSVLRELVREEAEKLAILCRWLT